MRTIAFALTALLLSLTLSQGLAEEHDKIRLNVLYLGRNADEQRTAAFDEFLTDTFRQCTVANRDDFEPSMLDGIDAVLIDLSQQEGVTGKYKSPVGPIEDWQTPTVLLGSAGLIMAGPWSVIGGAG